MSDKLDLAKLYSKQISFTEWFEDVDHQMKVDLRKEDNDKRERLETLSHIITIPYDKPTEFSANDLTNMNANVRQYIEQHKDELCALRLIPIEPELPKLRMRGQTVGDVINWYKEQKINPQKYRAQFMPHCDKYEWSTIFIVNKRGIFGEIIRGVHAQLTQGFHEEGNKPITFSYDFLNWKLSEDDKEALQHLKDI